jgi:branched-chain amino acid transport system substrate-binding protein
MKISILLTALAAAVALPASAEESVKIGVILPMSGPFANYGKQIENGIKLYMKQNGDKVAGKKIELLLRDDTGPAPEVTKRHAQELIVKDRVDLLAGFGLTPNGLAAAPLATEAKKPMIIMNAATSIITTKSPYIARFSMTLPQVTAPMATWAAKNGIKKVYTLVSDYGPGHDAEAQFKKTFTAAGGQIVGEVRVPLKSPDFSPYLQRIKDSQPEAVFIFLPAGEQGVAFMKGFVERGLDKAGIKLIATGDVTDDDVIEAMGDSALGVITSHHYSAAHDSALNHSFVKGYAEIDPKMRPNFMAVAGYDGMAAIYEALKKTNGSTDGDKIMAALKGMKLDSPRGPIMIDPETRDIVQNVYIRRVQKVAGKLYNVEFDKLEAVKDPGK